MTKLDKGEARGHHKATNSARLKDKPVSNYSGNILNWCRSEGAGRTDEAKPRMKALVISFL